MIQRLHPLLPSRFRPLLALPMLLIVSAVHANPIDLSKLPLPPGTKPVAVFPHTAIHVTDAPVDATAAACAKVLGDQGWTP